MIKINKKEIERNRGLVYLQILLMISLTITTAYFVHEASITDNNILNVNGINKPQLFALIMKSIGDAIFGSKGIVSALDSTDLSNGVSTCLKSKTGSICQEYPSSECAANCQDACIPANSNQISVCKLGTCYDALEGTCSTGSPKQPCIDKNGTWFDDPYGNVPQCQRGCCFVGDQTNFVTKVQCNRESSLLGINTLFKTEIKTELECVLNAKTQVQGACVFTTDFEKTCKFTTKGDCNNMKGNFNEGYLCSANQLGTNCKPQATTGCVQGRDEIYWFDSCGNRENIYDADKFKSFNNGMVLSKTNSCNILGNTATCGNCNYLLGSTCGLKTSTQKVADSSVDVVCRDLTCKDENGNTRQNGESWCAYQSSIGVDNVGTTNKGVLLQRSVDTVGSRDFRKVCINGEVQTEPCADYRNEVCVQADTPTQNNKVFSSAACRINRWQQCLEYNTELKKSKDDTKGITPDERDAKCTAR